MLRPAKQGCRIREPGSWMRDLVDPVLPQDPPDHCEDQNQPDHHPRTLPLKTPTKPRPKMPQLAWPNSVPIAPRKKTNPKETKPDPTTGPDQEPDLIPSRLPNSFFSNNKRTNRMTNPTSPTTTTPPSTPLWSTQSNWRIPSQATASVPAPNKTSKPKQPKKAPNKKNRWDQDSHWNPPTTTTAPTTTGSRPRRSNNKPINYNEN